MGAQLDGPEEYRNRRYGYADRDDSEDDTEVVKEPKQNCATELDPLFDDTYRAPCIIHSDDISIYGTIKTPPIVSHLRLDDWESRQFNLYLFAPLVSSELILSRQNFIGTIKDLPNFEEVWQTLRETRKIFKGLGGILAMQDNPMDETAICAMHKYRQGSEPYLEARADVEAGCKNLEEGRVGLQQLLSILPMDNPLLHPLREGFLKLVDVVGPFETQGVLEGVLGEHEVKAMAERAGPLMDRATFLFGMAKIIRDFDLELGTCVEDAAEGYKDGWNPFYLETRDHRNPSPAAEPVIGFSGDNNSGKSVSGVHQNFFIQVIWQATGFSCVGGGNFRIYDSFMLADRARTHHEMGDNAMGAEMRMYREAYPSLGRRFMLGLDEAFSTMSPEDQVLFLKGLGICARERGGKTFFATHSELFPEQVANLPGFKIYHFRTTNDPDGRPRYHYELTPGARGSNAVALAKAMHVIPQIVERAEQSQKNQLGWTKIQSLRPQTTDSPTLPHKVNNLIFVNSTGRSALKVFTLDSSMSENPLLDRYRSYYDSEMRWDSLASMGSLGFLEEFLLRGVVSSRTEIERRQRILKTAAERWDVEGVQRSIAGLATLASVHPTIPNQVGMLRDFNRHINPLVSRENQRGNIEALRLACRYLGLTRKLCGDNFKESVWIEEGAALESASYRFEAAGNQMSLRQVAKRINDARDIPLSLEEQAHVKEMLEACDDAPLVASMRTRGQASDYVRVMRDSRGSSSLFKDLLDALPANVDDEHTQEEHAQKTKLEQKREKYQEWQWANLTVVVKLHSVPETPNFSAIGSDIPNSTINGLALDEVPLSELKKWLKAQHVSSPADKGRTHYYKVAEAIEVATNFLNTSLTASEIELSGTYEWQAPHSTSADVKRRINSIVSAVSDSEFSETLPAANLFKFDAPSLATDVMPFLTPKEFYSPAGASLFGRVSVEWSLMQLLNAGNAPPNIAAQLRATNIPELTPIIDELESILSTLGVPNGGTSDHDHSGGKKIDHDPIKFWNRYHAIVQLFLTPDQFSKGETACSGGDAIGVNAALETMRTTSISQIIRGYGALFETRYAKRLEELDRIDQQLKDLAEKTHWKDASVNKAVAELLSGGMPPNEHALQLAEAFAHDVKTSDDEMKRIRDIASLDERRRRFKEYCTTVLAADEKGKSALKFIEDAKPFFDRTREIAERRKVLKKEDVNLMPGEVSTRLKNRYEDEAQKLFAFSGTRLNRMHVLLSEIRSIGIVAKALRDKELCLVDFNDEGRVLVKGLRDTIPPYNDKTVPQDYDFRPNAPAELLNGPNRSGKTKRSKMLAKGVTEALLFGVAPADSMTIPHLDGVVYVDRVTTKTASKFGSAGNEFLIWSKVLPEISMGNHLVIVDEAFSTMTPSDQSNFVPAMGVTVLESGNLLEFSCHNRTALEKLVATGAPVTPRFLGYVKDPTSGNLSFNYQIQDGYAPSEAVSMALQLHYPWDFLAGVLPPERKPPEPERHWI